jgi:SP family sugar:H+ symporter-like MFS transporter
MILQFIAGLPARKFRGYKCIGAAALAVDEKEPRISVEEQIESVVWTNPKAVTETAMYVE